MNDRVVWSVTRTSLLLLAAFIAWNFWLATARELFLRPATWHPLKRPNQDFVSYYIGGSAFRAGYNPYLDNGASDSQLSSPGHIKPYSRFKYPPTFLPLWDLLSRLDYDRSRSLWAAIYAGTYLLGFAAVTRVSCKAARPIFFVCAILLTITSDSILEHIQHGQADLVIAGLIAMSFAAHSHGYRRSSAAILALAFLIKVNPLFFLIYFVVFRRDFRFLGWFVLFAISMVAVSLIWVRAQFYIHFVFEVLPNATEGGADYHIQSLVRLVSGYPLLPQAVCLIGILGFASFAWVIGKRSMTKSTVEDSSTDSLPLLWPAMFLMNAVVILLFSGIAWHMTYCWVLIPATMLMAHMISQIGPNTHRREIWALIIILLCTFLTNARLWAVPVFDSLGLIGGIGLVAILGYWSIQQTSGATMAASRILAAR